MNPPLPPERAARIRELFEELSELPREQRATFLDTTCRDDAGLRQELTSLLQQADTSSPHFERLARDVVQPMLHALRDDPSGLNVLLDGMIASESDGIADDPLVGRTISHFDILAPIGRGGMGVVYKARDRDLDRLVALKFLPPGLNADPEAKARFVREARAASALDHANIGTVFEIGETADDRLFIAMACYEGVTLAHALAGGALPVDRTIAIATQLADALACAHARGVVHRDVKPGNILLTAEGTVKLVDFGLAKLTGTATVTQIGATAGTAAYMSPEQAEGHRVDHRTDIWALGVVLYEMLTGSRPFRSEQAQAVLHAILHAAPRAIRDACPAAPEPLAALVDRCLAKDPAQRPQSMAEVLTDLRALTGNRRASPWIRLARAWRRPRTRVRILAATALVAISTTGAWLANEYALVRTPRIDSLAVLPFRDLAGDPEQAYFTEGMQEALIGELAKISGLRVISRQSSARYGQSELTVPEIARELEVRGVVTGTVFREHDTVHLQVQLIEAVPEERPRWTQAFQDDLRNVMTMHSDVARAIAREVRVRLSTDDETRLAQVRLVQPETFESYLRGMHELNKPDAKNIAAGLAHFQTAIERNPADPYAYTGLAYGCVTAGHAPGGDPDYFRQARAAIDRALKLDPTLVEVHVALANLALYVDWDWAGFEEARQRATALNPNHAMLHYHTAWYHVVRQNFAEAVAEHRKAIALDPLTALHTVWMPGVYWWFGDYEEAQRELEVAQARFPDHEVVLYIRGISASELGQHDEAIATHEKLVARNRYWSWALACTYAVAGRAEDARREFADWASLPVNPWMALGMACMHGRFGDADEALRWLGYSPGYVWVPWVVQTPYFVRLRGDPRFTAILRRLKVPETYLHSGEQADGVSPSG